MFIHGGGFKGGTKTKPEIVEMGNYFASRGWVFISIDYRTTEELGNTQGMNETQDVRNSSITSLNKQNIIFLSESVSYDELPA